MGNIFSSYGLLNKIEESTISHKCKTGFGSSGSPILLLKTNTIIGVHCRGSSHNLPFNFGTFLVKPLIEFQNIRDNLLIIKKSGTNNVQKIISNQDIEYKDIDRIYTDLKNYYLNEKNISYYVNNQGVGQIYNGFLVDKIWVDKWKKYSCYEQIKSNYLYNNNYKEKEIKKIIIDNLSKNNLNYKEIDYVENYIIKDLNELKFPKNEKKSFVLLNSEFLNKFPFTKKISSINFNLNYQKIQIKNQDNIIFSFTANNNVILNENSHMENIYNSELLKNLIKFGFLKKELHSPNCFLQNQIYQVNIVKRVIIDKLVQIYKLKNILSILDYDKILSGMTYQNFEENYYKISNYLNKHQKSYIQSVKNLETQGKIEFSKYEMLFNIKFINEQRELKYIEDFEIINKNFANFLSKKFSRMEIPLAHIGKINSSFF